MKRCDEYRELRRRLGTQTEVAPLLGITQNALSDREMGHAEVREESFLALQLLIVLRERQGVLPPREQGSVPAIRSI